jgi:Ca2+-binding RTX toxin-like protein
LGNDSLSAGEGDDTAFGGEENDTIGGDTGNDLLFGNQGDDILVGGAGDDTLYGGLGKDILEGGTGKDLFIGGQGNDSLTGGEGADTFAFSFFGAENTDTLTDFDPTEDVIQLSNTVFSALDGTIDPSKFTTINNFVPGQSSTQGANLIYDKNQGLLYYVNELGVVSPIAQFDNKANLGLDDFEII